MMKPSMAKAFQVPKKKSAHGGSISPCDKAEVQQLFY